MPDEAILARGLEHVGQDAEKITAAASSLAQESGDPAPVADSVDQDSASGGRVAADTVPVPLAKEGSPSDWRGELAIKMQQYRTRRKPRGPKYPSLQLPFELPHSPVSVEAASGSSLALEHPLEDSFVPDESSSSELVETSRSAEAAPVTTNLIEFPRYTETSAWDGLAEPLTEQPRILDAPELAPPEPALGGILLEPPEETLPSATTEPLRPASIGRRCVALTIDVLFVGAAAVLWAWIFSKIAREIPPQPQLLLSTVVIAGALWLGYQFLLMTWSGTTLGLTVCRMELVSLEGVVPRRKQRRWRLLTSLLSAAALMLGYAWVLLDENGLCWHDRITRTYLRIRERHFL